MAVSAGWTHGLLARSVRASEWNSELSIAASMNCSVVNTICAYIYIYIQLLQFNLFAQCLHFILAIAIVSRHIWFKWNLAQVITLVAEWIDTYGIHHWKIFGSSYRKLAWVGFELTTTESHSDATNDWAIRPWVPLALARVQS